MNTIKNKYIGVILLSFFSIASFAQDAKNDLMLSMGYYNNNNLTQYLVAHAKTKIDGKFQMVPDVAIKFYINNDSAATNDKGDAILMMPPSAKAEWMKSVKHTFAIVSTPSKLYDEAKATVDVSKAKLKIDTTDDKKLIVTLLELKDTAWVPVKAVDLKVAIKRLDGDLNVNETATYTTDSTGTITAEFKRDSLPGDKDGNLTLIAKVEDNDIYGNLTAERVVKWGSKFQYVSQFDRRTLFARRGHSPWWLELLAYAIVVSVWGVLIYLVGQIKKIKKLGV
jgi:hypothetical protein